MSASRTQTESVDMKTIESVDCSNKEYEIKFISDKQEHIICSDTEIIYSKWFFPIGENISNNSNSELFDSVKEYLRDDSVQEVNTIKNIQINTSEQQIKLTVDTVKGDFVCHIYWKPIGVMCKYASGRNTYTCHYCGHDLEITCDHLQEKAYCEDCHIEYTRSREHIFDSDKKNIHRVYYCENCDRHHRRNKPKEEWSEQEPRFWSREEFGFICKCGNNIKGNDIPIDSSKECECGRIIKLKIED